MRFEVKRPEWYRGREMESALFVQESSRVKDEFDRKRCCLGFFANACGLSDDQICNCQSTVDIPKDIVRNFASSEWSDLKKMLINEMIRVNDDEYMSDKDREENLTALFKKAGHEIVFVN